MGKSLHPFVLLSPFCEAAGRNPFLPFPIAIYFQRLLEQILAQHLAQIGFSDFCQGSVVATI